jgi:phosphoglycolate phosphatase
MTRTAVFDLDGTLVDSAPDLHAALDRLMGRLGLPGFGRAEVIGMVGDGVKVLVTRALAARDRDFDQAALDSFTADYTANAAVETRPFAGIPEALDALQAAGWRLAVCTNKPVAAARELLSGLGLLGRFAAIGGGDSFAVRKPDPGHLLGTLAAAGGETAAAVMIGDHHNDVAAARGAGLPCIFAGWGYGPRSMADGAPVIEGPGELFAALGRLLPQGGR